MRTLTFRILGLVAGFVAAGVIAGAGIGYLTQGGAIFPLAKAQGNTAAVALTIAFALATGLAAYAALGWIHARGSGRDQTRRFAEIKALITQERQSFAALSRLWEQKELAWKKEKLARQRENQKWAQLREKWKAERTKLIEQVTKLRDLVGAKAEKEQQAEEAGRAEREQAQREWEEERNALLCERRGQAEIIATLKAKCEELVQEKTETQRKSEAEASERERELETRRAALEGELEKARRLLRDSADSAERGSKELEGRIAQLEERNRELEEERERLAAAERRSKELEGRTEQLEERTRGLEEERERLARRVAEAGAGRLDFLAKLSGSLRAPVARIGQVARTKADGPGAALAEIAALAESFLRLLEDVLDLAKIQARACKLVISKVGLEKVLSRSVAEHRSAAAGREIALVWNQAGDDLGSIAVDDRLMARCIGNLLDNAIRFTPRAGRVELRGKLVAEGGARRAVVEVRDTGIGIAPEDRERIFEPFVRGRQPRSEIAAGGAGLGLALVRAFVDLHGGNITFSSVPGEGSVFTLAFNERTPGGSRTEVESDEAVVAAGG